jgi:hypothetical protein
VGASGGIGLYGKDHFLLHRVPATFEVVEGEASLLIELVIACEGFLAGGLSTSSESEGQAAFQVWVDSC